MGVSVPGCVVAAMGAFLLAPASAWGWSSPVDLSSHTDFDQSPAVAINLRGDTAVAWQRQIDPYHSAIDTTVRPSGGMWSATQTLSVPADWQNMDPSVAVDGQGDTLVVWGATNAQSLGETRAAYARPGQPFDNPQQVGATYDGSVGDAYPFVAFDSADNAIAFWLEPDNRVYYAVRPSGGAFGAAQQVPHASSDTRASWPSYAVAGNGDAVVVWDGLDAEYAVIRNANGTFDAPQALDPGVQSGPPHVAMDAAGDALAVWAEQINNQGYMKAAIRPAGASAFESPVTIAQVPYTGNDEANVAMDSVGDGTIVWGGESSSPYVNDGPTVVTRRAGASGFSTPAPLGGPGAEEPPQVAYDAAANAYVVWRHYDTNTTTSVTGRVWAEVASADGMFPAQPTQISAGGYNVWPPALAAGPADSAAAVWPIGIFNGDASQFWIQEADTFTPSSAGSTASGPGPGTGTPASPGTVTPASPGTVTPASPGTVTSAGPGTATGTAAPTATVAARCAAPYAENRPIAQAQLGALVRCILRAQRAQLGLGYTQSHRLSQMVAAALRRLAGLRPRQASPAERGFVSTMARSVCPSGVRRSDYAFAGGTGLTPRRVASLVGAWFRVPGAAARAARSVLGVAAYGGPLFRNYRRRGASVGMVAVVCR